MAGVLGDGHALDIEHIHQPALNGDIEVVAAVGEAAVAMAVMHGLVMAQLDRAEAAAAIVSQSRQLERVRALAKPWHAVVAAAAVVQRGQAEMVLTADA